MKRFLLIISIYLVSMVYAYADVQATTKSGNLTIQIQGIRSALGGTMRVALFNTDKSYHRSDNSGSGAFKTAIVPIQAANSKLSVVINNIPYGTYAIKLYQDVDKSNSLKTDVFGRPKEDFGFSNNINASGGVPEFDKVMFVFDANHLAQQITMQKALVK